MIKLYICCLVLIIGSVKLGPDIDMKFHQEVMEIVSYDSKLGLFFLYELLMTNFLLFFFFVECQVQCQLKNHPMNMYLHSQYQKYLNFQIHLTKSQMNCNPGLIP